MTEKQRFLIYVHLGQVLACVIKVTELEGPGVGPAFRAVAHGTGGAPVSARGTTGKGGPRTA